MGRLVQRSEALVLQVDALGDHETAVRALLEEGGPAAASLQGQVASTPLAHSTQHLPSTV